MNGVFVVILIGLVVVFLRLMYPKRDKDVYFNDGTDLGYDADLKW